MPKHASKTGRTKNTGNEKAPLEQYNLLPFASKLICYKYHCNLVNAKEGWDITKAGSVHHLRTSQLLIENLDLTDNQFRHLGKRMVTLAKTLKQQNITLLKPAAPFLPNLPTTTDPAPPPNPAPPLSATPSPAKKPRNNMTSPSRFTMRSITNTVSTLDEMSCAGLAVEVPLPVPHYSGCCKQAVISSDGTYQGRSTHVELRHIIDNFAAEGDFEAEFVEPECRVLKIRRKQPEFMQKPCQQNDVLLDESNTPVHQKFGEVMSTMADSQQERADEHGVVSDRGVITFDQKMEPSTLEISLEEVPFNGKSGQILVIRARAAMLKTKTPVKATAGARRLKSMQQQGGKSDMDLEEVGEEVVSESEDEFGDDDLARERASKRKQPSPTNHSTAILRFIPQLFGKATKPDSSLTVISEPEPPLQNVNYFASIDDNDSIDEDL